LGISVEDAEVGGDVVILRSVLDMVILCISSIPSNAICLGTYLETARLIEQERYGNRIQAINHSYSLTSPHSRWRCLTRGGGYFTSPLLCSYTVGSEDGKEAMSIRSEKLDLLLGIARRGRSIR
jgi:hypothetical protein